VRRISFDAFMAGWSLLALNGLILGGRRRRS
jgi:hypothetical protein